MAFYRVYRLNIDNRIDSPPISFECDCDDDAADAARALLDGNGQAEIWQEGRFVGRVVMADGHSR